MTRRQLLSLSAVATAGLSGVVLATDQPIVAYEAIQPICAGCGSHLLYLERVPPTMAPQRVMCVSNWCEHFEKEIRVQLFRKLA